MNLELYTELRNDLEIRLENADNEIKKFPVKSNGLIELTPAFMKAKRAYSIVFNQLRALNSNTPNKILREYSMKKRFNK